MKLRPDKLDVKMKNRLFWIGFAGLLVFFTAFLVYGSTAKEFWYDEMAMVGFVCGDTTIPELLHTYLTKEASNLPLYALLLWPVYHIMPAREYCLLSLSVLLTVAATVFLSLFAKKRYGRIASIAIVVMSICSKTVCNRIGLELRAYSLMYFGVAFTLYMLLLLHEEANRRRYVFTTIAMCFLLFSHYFGVLLFAILGAGALFLVILRKKKFPYLIPFLISGALFTPWFVLTRCMTDVSASDFWIPRPAFMDVPKTVAYLLGGNPILTAAFGIAWICLLVSVVKEKQWVRVETVLLVVPVLIMGGVFVYSRYLSRGGGLYENRYFIAVLPLMLLVLAAALEKGMALGKKNRWIMVILLPLLPALLWSGHRTHVDMVCQMRDASDPSYYILQQGDGNDADVRIVALSYDSIGDYRARGWGDFYIKRQGGITAEIHYTRDPSMEELFAIYASEGIRRVYVMADKDYLEYADPDYERIELDDTRRLTVFERR